MTKNELRLYDEKTLETWNQGWVRVEGGLESHQPQLAHVFGLYRYTLDGRDMVLGTGTDQGGGLAKRPSDFIRPSNSGRNYPNGEWIHDNRRDLTLWVLITGSDETAMKTARRLKWPMIKLRRPERQVPPLFPKATVKKQPKPYRGPVPPIRPTS